MRHDGRKNRKRDERVEAYEVSVEATMEFGAGDPKQRLRRLAMSVLKEVRSAQMHKIPMLPGVATRAMELAQRERVDLRSLEAIIAPDAMITARVLAIANSPLYGVGNEVRSLRTAMLRLGVDLMCDVLYQTVAEAHMFKGRDIETLRWQRLHGVACAYMAREISSRLDEPIQSPFLCGLMHDLGETVLSQVIDDPATWQIAEHELPSIVHYIHPSVGEAIAARWRLPAVIAEANRRHHRYKGFSGGSGYSKVGNVVQLADRLMSEVGVIAPSVEGIAPLEQLPIVDPVFTDLGLGCDDVEDLRAKAAEIHGQLGL